MSNLTLIASKYRPFREDKDPRTWVLYKDTADVHMTHDRQDRPFVLDKCVA